MKPFTGVAVALIALIAVLQLVRFALGWPVSINGTNVPPWLSAVAFIVLGGIALMAWRERRAGR
jgi:hypothetical protein